MKHLTLIFTATALLLLTGCETIDNGDGTTTTRFDAKAATGVIETGFNTWDRIERQNRIIGYDQLGNPIYR